MVWREWPVTRAVAEMLTPSTRRLAPWSHSLRAQRRPLYAGVMESFFSTVKSELADRFDSFGEAKMELFDYLEVFYNQRRRHSTLGQISPAVFERRAAQAA